MKISTRSFIGIILIFLAVCMISTAGEIESGPFSHQVSVVGQFNEPPDFKHNTSSDMNQSRLEPEMESWEILPQQPSILEMVPFSGPTLSYLQGKNRKELHPSDGERVVAVSPVPQWSRCIGGSGSQSGRSTRQTTDGGYILAGYTNSSDGDFTGAAYHGGFDATVAKLSSTGMLQWTQCVGSSYSDLGYSVQQIGSDGGFILSGMAGSGEGDFTGSGWHNRFDAFVAKLSSTGTVQWTRCIGGTGNDASYSVQLTTSDGGFIIAGETNSSDGDLITAGYHGNYDAFVAKISSTGTVQWTRCIGGSANDLAWFVQPTIDGGFVVAGATNSSDGNFASAGVDGGYDAFVAKISSTGTVEWTQCVGSSLEDSGHQVLQTPEGGFILVGYAGSSDGDFTGRGYHGNFDAFISKLSSVGTIEWIRCIGGGGLEASYSVQQTNDGGYILSGETSSSDGDFTGAGYHDSIDAFLVKTCSNGVVQWAGCVGGSSPDSGFSVRQTADGGFILAGETLSFDGDFIAAGYHGNWDAFAIRIPDIVGKSGVFRNGFWILERSGNFLWDGPPNDIVAGFGMAGDIPVVADWNCDIQENIGLFRSGFWILDHNGNFQWDGVGTGNDLVAGFGGPGDVPVYNDWNGDGCPEIGVFRASGGQWIIDHNGNFLWDGTGAGQDIVAILGQTGDTPVGGNWDASGSDNIGIFRGGFWILDGNGNFQWDGPPGDIVAGFGMVGDIPLVADWNCDGHDDIGIFRNGFWILDYNGNFQWNDVGTGNDLVAGFGAPGDMPVVKDWNGDGCPEIGVFRTSTGQWIIDYNRNFRWDGTGPCQDVVASLGQPGDLAAAGIW